MKSAKGKGQSEELRTCLACGCTEWDCCLIEDVPCMWATEDLCSGCADAGEVLETAEGRDWMLAVMCHVEEYGPVGHTPCLAEQVALDEAERARRERETWDDE